MPLSKLQRSVLLVLPLLLIVAECKKKKEAPPPPLLSQDWSAILGAVVTFLSQSKIYTSLALCASTLLLKSSSHDNLPKAFKSEAVGSVIMVFLTFSPGPFVGHRGKPVEWLAHMVGVMLADWSCGGPHVNPGVTAAMYAWGKLDAAQALVHVAGQVAGGIIAFPALNGLGELYGAKIGGPEFVTGGAMPTSEAAINEFLGTFALLMLVFVICTTWFGDGAYDYTKASNLVYVRKQSTFAAGLRLVIVLCHRTGPAVNGMLATTWAFYKTGAFPRDPDHYLVYWGAHVAGAVLATVAWSAHTKTGMYAADQKKQQ